MARPIGGLLIDSSALQVAMGRTYRAYHNSTQLTVSPNDIKGIALFGGNNDGTHVDLELRVVYQYGGTLFSINVALRNREKSFLEFDTGQVNSNLGSGIFEHNDYLTGTNGDGRFGFGYLLKEEVESLLSFNGVTHLLVSGMQIQVGTGYRLSGDYFNLKIEPYPIQAVSFPANSVGTDLGVPGFRVAIPCPPYWRPGGQLSKRRVDVVGNKRHTPIVNQSQKGISLARGQKVLERAVLNPLEYKVVKPAGINFFRKPEKPVVK